MSKPASLPRVSAFLEKTQSGPYLNAHCPACGGPAFEEQFWSESPEEPGVRILKYMLWCGGRPFGKLRPRPGNPPKHCPVVVKEIERQTLEEKPMQAPLEATEVQAPKSVRGRLSRETREEIFRLSQEGQSIAEIAQAIGRSEGVVSKLLLGETRELDAVKPAPSREDLPGLNQTIEFLAQLPDDAIEEVVKVARLQREHSQLRQSLENRLKRL